MWIDGKLLYEDKKLYEDKYFYKLNFDFKFTFANCLISVKKNIRVLFVGCNFIITYENMYIFNSKSQNHSL